MQQILSIWREQITLNNLKMIVLATLHRWKQVWVEKPLLALFTTLFFVGPYAWLSLYLESFNVTSFHLFISHVPIFIAIVMYFSRMSVGAKTAEHFVQIFFRSFFSIFVFIVGAAFIVNYFYNFFMVSQFRYILMCTFYTYFTSWFILAVYDQRSFFSSLYAAFMLMLAYIPIIIASVFGSYIIITSTTFICFVISAISGGFLSTECAIMLVVMQFVLLTLAISAASVMYIRVVHNYYDLIYTTSPRLRSTGK